MPAVMKIKQKPKGIGCDVKTAADVLSGILLNLEINEGKDVMKDLRWQKELGAGTATTLRVTEACMEQDRLWRFLVCVCEDSCPAPLTWATLSWYREDSLQKVSHQVYSCQMTEDQPSQQPQI